MSITANRLYRDSFNFLRNELFTIVLLTLFAALTTVMINYSLLPTQEQLNILETTKNQIDAHNIGIKQIISQMSPEQQMAILKISACEIFSILLGHVLLIGGMLSIMIEISNNRPVRFLKTLSIFLPVLPKLFLLVFICTLLIQFGLAAFIVPGIMIALSVSFSPIILINEKVGIFSAINRSSKMAFTHSRLIIPAMLLWGSSKLLLLLFLSINQINISSHNTMILIFNAVNYFLLAFLLVYLFRLYMLLRA
ncbi:YciC family protein [Candidatus Williamhamiltonella defendens]|uniref:YciC family protein n=1 Tax=Candidatus Williamhamiltonella defendens TaxID=138072 RepID=UPI00130D7FE5|nr:YciC family protein [Candidatus Hamiltonella defensa]